LEMMGDISLKFHRSDDFTGHVFNLVFSGHYFPATVPSCSFKPAYISSDSYTAYNNDLPGPWKGIIIPPPRTHA
jgi:hypothetical protein